MVKKSDSTDWYVQTYGIVVDDYTAKIGNRKVEQKIYSYDGRLFVETWDGSYRVLFHELFD